jgi:hypothetical protein
MNKHMAKLWARTTVRSLVVGAVALALSGMALAQFNAEDFNLYQQSVVKFKDAIGVIPVTGVAATGAVNLNIVRGVSPGAPWRIAGLAATVNSDGHILVVGKGLLLANGNGIGTNGSQRVHASLFCGPAATATEFDTDPAGVPLATNGDFTIAGPLSSVPAAPCDTPVLLIRNVGGVWFAAGIPDLRAHY